MSSCPVRWPQSYGGPKVQSLFSAPGFLFSEPRRERGGVEKRKRGCQEEKEGLLRRERGVVEKRKRGCREEKEGVPRREIGGVEKRNCTLGPL